MAKFQIVEGYKAAKKENNPIKMVKASSTQKVGEAVSSENLEKTA